MKRLTLLIVVLLLMPSVAVLGYPRHVDPSGLRSVEPDPNKLFLVYHNIYMGMLLENVTIQDEWFDWAGEVYSVPDLGLLLEHYGDQLLEQAGHLNATQFYLDLAVEQIGEFDLAGAQASFFMGIAALERSNASIPGLTSSTIDLGVRLKANPQFLLDDIDAIKGLVGEYGDFAQLLVDYVSGADLSEEDLDDLRDILEGVVDEDYLESIEDGLDLGSLTITSLTLDVEPSSVYVGEEVTVSGRLSGTGGLEGKVVEVKLGDDVTSFVTGIDGQYEGTITVPYIYQESMDVRATYWPRGDDVSVFSPASAVVELELLFDVPVLEYTVSDVYPGKLWNVSGAVEVNGVGVPGSSVSILLDGTGISSVTDETGAFNARYMAPAALGETVNATISVAPSGVVSGVSESFILPVSRVPLSLVVDASSLVFSGGFAQLNCRVEAGGVELDGCQVRVDGVEDKVGYSEDGFVQIKLYTDLGRVSGDSGFSVRATPVEPWIRGASFGGSFYVVSSILVFGLALSIGVAAYYIYRNLNGDEYPDVDDLYVTPQAEDVIEAEPTGVYALYAMALRVVFGITGLFLGRSETIREYLARIGEVLGGRVFELFRELSLLYERWLYGRPGEVGVERLEELVVAIEDESDE